jgi:hypothetical protein
MPLGFPTLSRQSIGSLAITLQVVNFDGIYCKGGVDSSSCPLRVVP